MFVQVNGTLEPDALAASIASDVLGRAAEAVVLTVEHLGQDGNGLNETQKIALVRTAMRSFDGVQADVEAEVSRQIEWANRSGDVRAELD